MYYDDTAPRVHFPIGSEDRPPVVGALPAPDDQQAIRDAVRPGWGPERVSAHLRRIHGRDISPDTVRFVLAHGTT